MGLVDTCGVQSSCSSLQLQFHDVLQSLTPLGIPAVGPALLPHVLHILRHCKGRLTGVWEGHHWHLKCASRTAPRLWFLQPRAWSPEVSDALRGSLRNSPAALCKGTGSLPPCLVPQGHRAALSTVSCEDFDFPLQLLPERPAALLQDMGSNFLWSSVRKEFITISLSPLVPGKGTAFLIFPPQHCSRREAAFLLISSCVFSPHAIKLQPGTHWTECQCYEFNKIQKETV